MTKWNDDMLIDVMIRVWDQIHRSCPTEWMVRCVQFHILRCFLWCIQLSEGFASLLKALPSASQLVLNTTNHKYLSIKTRSLSRPQSHIITNYSTKTHPFLNSFEKKRKKNSIFHQLSIQLKMILLMNLIQLQFHQINDYKYLFFHLF